MGYVQSAFDLINLDLINFVDYSTDFNIPPPTPPPLPPAKVTNFDDVPLEVRLLFSRYNIKLLT